MLKLCLAAAALVAGLSCAVPKAQAWNEEGHRVVALIALHYLDPAVKHKVDALLASDTDGLTAHDLAGEATWMDAYIRALQAKDPAAAARIGSWQSVAIEIDHPDLDAACSHHPKLPAGTLASAGPAACVVDKIDQFSAELAAGSTPWQERVLALKYLVALVADLHQPIYASDNHDKGGTALTVSGGGSEPGSLRNFWDADLFDYLGDDPAATADDLADGIRQSKAFAKMSAGTPSDWAMESFAAARDHAYGKLPAKKQDGTIDLPPDYVTGAIETVRVQLARAGVRLAALLNHALASGG